MTSATNRAKVLARPRVLVPLTVLLAAGILSADVSSSDAVGQKTSAASCTLNVPTRVHISAPHQSPSVTLGADCAAAGVIDARWEAKRADGVVTNKLFFNFNYPESWSVYDNASLAPVTWQPAGAISTTNPAIASQGETPSTGGPNAAEYQAADVAVPQNSPTTDIRMVSKVELVPTNDEKVQVWAQRYAIAPHGLINYGGRTGSIQQLNKTSGGWFVLKSFTTDSVGRWTIDNLDNVVGEPGEQVSIRVVIYDGQYIFGSISPTYIGTICGDDGTGCPLTKAGGQTFLGLSNVRTEPNSGDPGPLPEPPSGR